MGNEGVVQEIEDVTDELLDALSGDNTGEVATVPTDDELKEGGEVDADTSGAEDDSSATEVDTGKSADEAAGEGEADEAGSGTGDETGGEGDEGVGEGEDEVIVDRDAELRQLLREEQRTNRVLLARINRLETGAKTKSEDDDIFGDLNEGGSQELSEVEVLQNDINQAIVSKGPALQTLLEVMRFDPEYKDINEVCSKANMDYIYDAVGRDLAQGKEGADPVVESLKIERDVWSKPNPYAIMYKIIKEYHPAYAKAKPKEGEDKVEVKDEKKEADAKTQAEIEKRKTTPAEGVDTIVDKGGDHQDAAGAWTAERIDSLEDDELDSVPKEIYEKYLRGDLD